MIRLFIFLLVLLLIEMVYRPRLDYTRDERLLWYGRKTRKYIIIN